MGAKDEIIKDDAFCKRMKCPRLGNPELSYDLKENGGYRTIHQSPEMSWTKMQVCISGECKYTSHLKFTTEIKKEFC